MDNKKTFAHPKSLRPTSKRETDADKNKTFAQPKSLRSTSKREIETPSTSRKNEPPRKDVNLTCRKSTIPSKINLRANATFIGDETMFIPEDSMLDYDKVYADITYSQFLRSMLEECLVDEKIEKVETQMDLQMAQLADRFQKTVDQLDKTNRRLKDISFAVEHKRLYDLKNQDHSNFFNITNVSGIEDGINDLTMEEESCLDILETKNVDFGYDTESGHRQLLDAVTDAVEGLEKIKNNSNLDVNKFKEFENSRVSLEEIEKDRFDMERLKTELKVKFPKFSEQLLKYVSDMIEANMENDD